MTEIEEVEAEMMELRSLYNASVARRDYLLAQKKEEHYLSRLRRKMDRKKERKMRNKVLFGVGALGVRDEA